MRPFFVFMKYNHAIKRFIRARSPRLLEIEMLKNNTRRGMFFKYDHIQQASDGLWYAWFLDERNDPIELSKELNDSSND